jgi:hypothetical protein
MNDQDNAPLLTAIPVKIARYSAFRSSVNLTFYLRGLPGGCAHVGFDQSVTYRAPDINR